MMRFCWLMLLAISFIDTHFVKILTKSKFT